MSDPSKDVAASAHHALNNLMCKILGTAELALDRVDDPGVQADLRLIMNLAEQAGLLLHRAQASAPTAPVVEVTT